MRILQKVKVLFICYFLFVIYRFSMLSCFYIKLKFQLFAFKKKCKSWFLKQPVQQPDFDIMTLQPQKTIFADLKQHKMALSEQEIS
jgi:hypothetical protein